MNETGRQNTKVHNSVVGVLTVAAVAATAESISQGWEYWVPPLIVIGIIASWIMHILQYRQESFRENFYLVFAMVLAFYHGVHESGMFDIVVVSLLLMITATLFRRTEYLNILLAEFFILLIIQVVRSSVSGALTFDHVAITRILLHFTVGIASYFVLREIIKNNEIDTGELEQLSAERQNDKDDMEDFLVNISHELRTPVNVINGLSTIMRKKEENNDVISISDAGVRLAQQIDNIQDYSEIQRGSVLIEEENYMITSLINDIIAGYSVYQKEHTKDLVVDLDPSVPSVLKGDVRKIFRILAHLLDNAFKFTNTGGVYLRITTINHGANTNLVLSVTDTGIGLDADEIEKINLGMYQSNRKRSRSTGGIGLGLPIVYGFVRSMNGFINIESKKGKGTTVHVSITQEVIDPTPCLRLNKDRFFNVIYHFDPNIYKDSRVWEFYREMAVNTASDLRINMYFAPTAQDVEKLLERGDITNVFMGEKEYNADPGFYDRISRNVTLAVSTTGDLISQNKRIVVLPRPLYGLPIIRVLNGEEGLLSPISDENARPDLDNVRALVVDDERLNLIVAKGIFKGYNMIVDTASSGKEAIQKFSDNEYDVVFMDHMMPQMDGVEAAKRIKDVALQQQKTVRIVAFTANVVSGAREMFMNEGFAGFIGKPIDVNEFERTMKTVLPNGAPGRDKEERV